MCSSPLRRLQSVRNPTRHRLMHLWSGTAALVMEAKVISLDPRQVTRTDCSVIGISLHTRDSNERESRFGLNAGCADSVEGGDTQKRRHR